MTIDLEIVLKIRQEKKRGIKCIYSVFYKHIVTFTSAIISPYGFKHRAFSF